MMTRFQTHLQLEFHEADPARLNDPAVLREALTGICETVGWTPGFSHVHAFAPRA